MSDARFAETLMQQAVALHQQGRLDEAARGYIAVLDREPADVNALIDKLANWGFAVDNLG